MRTVRVSVLIMMVAMSACQMTLPDIGRGARKAPETLRLSASNLKVTAPEGYCIDLESHTERDGASFLLMASCAPLRGKSGEEEHGKTTLLTVTVTPPFNEANAVTPATLDTFFQTPDGKKMLAHSGASEDIDVLWSGTEADAFLIHARDASGERVPGLATDYWRAMTVLEGRLLSVTSARFVQAQTPNPTPKAIVQQLVSNIRASNIDTGTEIVSN
jgi:hypothetical protein